MRVGNSYEIRMYRGAFVSYVLEVEYEALEGRLLDTEKSDAWIKRRVIDALDGRDLTEVTGEQYLEGVVDWVWERLECSSTERLVRVRICSRRDTGGRTGDCNKTRWFERTL